MDYIEVTFTITPKDPASEILIAELGELDFDMFVENEKGIIAYIPFDSYNNSIFENINILKSTIAEITYSSVVIKDQNWNSEWEKNFNPIEINDNCIVRAPFHNLEKSYKYDLIIEPKMSFGTGHHETTFLMLNTILKFDLESKDVLDMGCGSALLSILASKLKAKFICAVDIDDWAIENSIENVQRNNCSNIEVVKGDANILFTHKTYDVILANINRNILLRDMGKYVSVLKNQGILLISGFFETDIYLLQEEAKKLGLETINQNQKNKWATLCLRYIK